MSDNTQLPRVGYDHEGAGMRNDAVFRAAPQTLDQAIAELETEIGRSLTPPERAEFEHGWAAGAVTACTRRIDGAIRRLSNAELETLARDLRDVAAKYGIVITL